MSSGVFCGVGATSRDSLAWMFCDCDMVIKYRLELDMWRREETLRSHKWQAQKSSYASPLQLQLARGQSPGNSGICPMWHVCVLTMHPNFLL